MSGINKPLQKRKDDENMNKESAKTATAKTAKTKSTTPAPAAPAPAATPAPVIKPVTKPFSSDGSLAKLRVGDVYEDKGVKIVVWFLNESRACIAPLNSHIEVRYRDGDGMPTFMATKSLGNISPNTEVTTIQQLGRKGLAELLEKRKTEPTETNMKKTTEKKTATAKTAKTKSTTPGIRAGSLGTLFGFSIASVVRTLATKGWKFAEIRKLLDDKKVEASDQTIKLNIYRAHHTDRPDSANYKNAPLKPDQIPAKPVIEEKAKKSSARTAKKAVTAPAKKAAAKPAAAKPAAKTAPANRAADQIKELKAKKAAAAKKA